VRYNHIIVFLPTCALLLWEIHKEAANLVNVNDLKYWKGNALALEATYFTLCLLTINTHCVNEKVLILM
jgi:hypothetical protein